MKTVTTILAALFAAYLNVASAFAGVTINPILPTSGEYLQAPTINGINRVATITVDAQDHGLLFNQLQVEHHGSYTNGVASARVDMCILDGDKIIWQSALDFTKAWEYFNLNIFVGHAKKKQFAVGLIRRSHFDEGVNADIMRVNFYLGHNPGSQSWNYGTSGWVQFVGHESSYVWIDPASSVKDIKGAKPGNHLLGGFQFEGYTSNWWIDDEDLILTNPTFRLYTEGGKITDIVGLNLRDETGAVLLKKAKVVERDGYALIQFQGGILMPKGEVSLFVHGRVGGTFRKEGRVALAFVPKDQGVIESTVSGMFTIDEDYAVRSREISFGVVSPNVPTPLPEKG